MAKNERNLHNVDLASAFAVGYTECEFRVVPKAACGWLGKDRGGAAFLISEGSSIDLHCIYSLFVPWGDRVQQWRRAARGCCFQRGLLSKIYVFKFLSLDTWTSGVGVGWATLWSEFMATLFCTWRCARFWGDKWHARCPSWRSWHTWHTWRWRDDDVTMTWRWWCCTFRCVARCVARSRQAGGHSLSAMRQLRHGRTARHRALAETVTVHVFAGVFRWVVPGSRSC